MRLWLGELWNDDCGSLLVTEWVFVATILVLGILPTVISIRGRMHQAAIPMDSSNGINVSLSCGSLTAD
jgi:hypothetical protein